MKRYHYIFLLKILIIGIPLFKFSIMQAQTYTMGREEYISWDEFIADYFDEIGEASGYSETKHWQTDVLEYLEELHQHPININTAKREDILRIPVLTAAQADSILSYRKKKHLLRSLGELQWITGIPYHTRCKLSLFAYAGDTIQKRGTFLHHLYKGKHDIVTRFDFPLYQREGDKDFTKSEIVAHPSKYYIGHKFANTIRYRYSWKKDLAYGVTLQKDSGEPFAAQNNYPYDYNSFYFFMRHKSHKYAFWLGDYNVSLGEGLLMSSSFFYGPLQLTENNIVPQRTIRPHSSSDESNFLRGGAAFIRFNKNWSMNIFASYKKLDGRLRNDTIFSFKTDGLHRTITEMDNRKVCGNVVAGTEINFHKDQWTVAANAYWSQYTKHIYPAVHEYNKYYLRGKSAAGFSIDYEWHSKKWYFKGETAIDKSFNWATTNLTKVNLANNLSFFLQERSLSPRFVAPFGKALQENSHVQNEHGIILGSTFQAFHQLKITAYLDYFYHPRPTFHADQSSNGLEFYTQAKYAQSKHLYFTLRYKMKTEKQNVTGHKNVMEYKTYHRNRITANYSVQNFYLNISADMSIVTRQTSQNTFGWMLSSRSHLKFAKKVSLHTFIATFFTDDYASRLYAYEPQLQYAASFPTFAYHGLRFTGVTQWKFCKNGYAALKYGWIHYFNRDHISSGPQQINASSKNDLSIQIGWHF